MVIDGTFSSLSPTPFEPLKAGKEVIKTLWGYMAYKTGSYEAVREHDLNAALLGWRR
ncbi:MAG: DUF499 domain-containing protein [Acidilobaceae archaeon]